MLDKKLAELYNEIGNRYHDIATKNGKYILYYIIYKILKLIR